MKSQLYQTLTVFSDGSLSVELALNNNKKVTNLVKDLKNFKKFLKTILQIIYQILIAVTRQVHLEKIYLNEKSNFQR